MGVWNDSHTMWDSFKISALMQKNLPFIVSGILACVCMLMYVYARMKLAYVGLEHAYVYACPRTHAVRFPWPLFSKNRLFSS